MAGSAVPRHHSSLRAFVHPGVSEIQALRASIWWAEAWAMFQCGYKCENSVTIRHDPAVKADDSDGIS